MRNIILIARQNITGSMRSRWFLGYSLIFIIMVVLIFVSGVTESRVMGFTGLTRMLLVFIQACNIIMPIFVLITTVRTIAGDRESNVLEYMLSFPVSLFSYYFGKFIGRFIIIFLPLLFALILSLIIGALKTHQVPVDLFLLYTGLLAFNAFAFLGIGFFISSVIKSMEFALGAALFVWLFLIAFIDIALIGFMIKQLIPETVIYITALLNPVQVFRIGAISLFDPVLSVIGPASFFILDTVGQTGCIIYALIYPLFIGLLFAFAGYKVFTKHDIL
ncbi:MAG: ABC transporter permease subunit [Candidatus Mucispirillum faecigallinarum]|nr:ABC transporter permease subunit [Candidatus Mucispirillum faecigallinarum]